jgi:putative nucleotidyltransferase with HDIG domain
VQEIAKAEAGAWRDKALACGYGSAISLPLRVAGEVVGSLNIFASEPGAFGTEEMSLLSELGGDIGFGIAMLRVRAEREEDARKLERSLEDTIQAIATTIEARDPYTAGHQKRVSQLAGAIAREMGLPESQITGVIRGAEIHDIGKIYIPSEILSRPGRLSATEFNLIKIHPQVGYDIIKEIDFPWPVAAMILQHHERIDGTGYPNALKGDGIIVEARILAVADVVDAMVSHRPYRAALGLDAALDEIVHHRGTLYDPAVVDVCVQLFREKAFVFA